MCFYIGIEDLAANALIEMMSKDQSKRFVSYEKLERYGAEVVKFLANIADDHECDHDEKKSVLILSRENTDAMFRNYSDIFEETAQDGQPGIQLKPGVTIDDLITTFRGYLALDVLLAFVNQQTVAKLEAA
ncbi:MAG: hypothetical protein IJG85_00170 [Eubacteriaceae bacterium]|nr:hypothetical protein [Eubacteriaceae bacterium]